MIPTPMLHMVTHVLHVSHIRYGGPWLSRVPVNCVHAYSERVIWVPNLRTAHCYTIGQWQNHKDETALCAVSSGINENVGGGVYLLPQSFFGRYQQWATPVNAPAVIRGIIQNSTQIFVTTAIVKIHWPAMYDESNNSLNLYDVRKHSHSKTQPPSSREAMLNIEHYRRLKPGMAQNKKLRSKVLTACL